MNRKDDWPHALMLFLADRNALPFSWGFNDCCTFAASAVRSITGVNFLADIPAYSTPVGAMLVARRAFGVRDAIDPFGALKWPERFGLEEIPVQLAQRGDVIAMKQGDAIALGIVSGTQSAFATENGLGWFRTLDGLKAWRI